MAQDLETNRGVYLVPALTGMGAPYWEPNARGSIFGITRDKALFIFEPQPLKKL